MVDGTTIDYSDQQQRAIDTATGVGRNRLCGISGPAGSGKTTIIKEACRRLRDRGRTVVLAAPTGRAARRISEATGYPAVTVHRLLEYGMPVLDPTTGEPVEDTRPARWGGNDPNGRPLTQDDVIVDEYAMIPWELHNNLQYALKPGARLICVGDTSQLPPVERHEITSREGTPFEGVLGLSSSVILDHVFRQAEDSGILFNANRIRCGVPPLRRPDFDIKYTQFHLKSLREVIDKSGLDFNSFDAQIVTPAKWGPLGSRALSELIQSIVRPCDQDGMLLQRPHTDAKRQPNWVVRVDVGEKVVCTKNTYDMRDFETRYARHNNGIPVWSSFIPTPDRFMMLNGEVGIITDIKKYGALIIQMGDREVEVPHGYYEFNNRSRKLYWTDPREGIDLAYAMTTHKMQGSEVDHVVYLMSSRMNTSISRNNFYTAATRAKKGVIVITDVGSINTAVTRTAQVAEEIYRRNKAKKGWKIGDS